MKPCDYIPILLRLGRRLRDHVLEALRRSDPARLEGLARPSRLPGEAEEGDISYAIDRVGEEGLVRLVEEEFSGRCGVTLIAEGIRGAEGLCVGPARARSESVRLIVDPIDGTRGLMTQKRSAWVLCGIAPDHGPATTLRDIVAAAQIEIPTLKQWRADVLWATRGGGAEGEWEDVRTGERGPLPIRPSSAETLEHGFASFARFFPGARDVLARIEEEWLREVVGPPPVGRAIVFEDQYISTGGQLYEMMMGHDRFIADVRPLMNPVLDARGFPRILCCHPYDLAAMLVAEEAGVAITDAGGNPMDAPLDTETECSWIAYANPALRRAIEPALLKRLRERITE